MVKSNLSNSLCQFWNNKSIPIQILYPSSVSWKKTPLYFFSSKNIRFAQKEPIKVKIFENFECSGQICQIPYVNFETTSRFLSKFCIPLQFHERYLLWTFLARTIYTLLLRNPLKWKCLRLSSARGKINQIPHGNFEMTSQFLFTFCIILHFHDKKLLCGF